MSKYSKTRHNVIKNIIKALEARGMSEAVLVVREVYPKGEAQQKANPESRNQLRKKYWHEVIAPQLRRENLDEYISFRKAMSEKVKNFIKRVDEILGS